MTDLTFNNTIQSPPPKRRRLAGTMSSSTPSLQPSALDRTRSLRKPTSTARLTKESTTTGAVGTSAGSSTITTNRSTGIGAPKQRPVSTMKMPSTTKGTLPAPGAVSRTVGSGSMVTAIGGTGIKRMARVGGTESGNNNSSIKPPASGGLARLASTRVKREGVRPEDSGIETGARAGTGISSGAGSKVGSGAAATRLPSTSIPATKSTTSTISGLKQPLRARAPTVSALNMAAKATPLSPPTTTPLSISGSFGMTRPTILSSSGSMATITSPRTTATSGSGSRIGTSVGIGGKGHARTQSATISSPKPATPKPGPRSTEVSGTSATPKSSLGTGKGAIGVGKASESPKSISKGVFPPSTPATATPKAPTTTGGGPKPSIGAGLGPSPAHKRTGSAASVSTTGTATTTGTNARTAKLGTTASTATTTQPGRLATSRKPLSLQPPKQVTSASAKPPPPSATTSSITRPTATAKPLLRQPNPTASTASTTTTTTTKTAVPKPKGTHLPGPGPALHTSTSSQASQQHPPPHHDHDFDTYQQHYTPAKVPLAPKPLTSTILAPPTPSKQPANVAASAETSRLQTELLQLHLLHRDADRTRKEWEGDAKRKLRERWERVKAEESEVGKLERVLSEETVVEELLAMLSSGFSSSGSSAMLGVNIKLEEEKIQALDEVISGVWAMSEPSSLSNVTMGKYTRVVKRFEEWAERAERILKERRGTEHEGGGLKLDVNGQVEMAGVMDVGWKNECAALGRRLEEWRTILRELEEHGGPFKASTGAGARASFRASRSIHGVKDLQVVTDPEEEEDDDDGEPSALDRILSGFGSLVNNMLAELEIMEQIEREAVAEENEWVREMNRVDDEKEEEGKQAGAVWRAF